MLTNPKSSVSVWTVFCSDAELGLTGADGPVDLNASFQFPVDSVEDGARKLRVVFTVHNKIPALSCQRRY